MSTVRIHDLESRLRHHLGRVQAGESVTVLDEREPVATIVPAGVHEPLAIRKPTTDAPRLQAIPLPAPVKLPVRVVDVLREERQGRR